MVCAAHQSEAASSWQQLAGVAVVAAGAASLVLAPLAAEAVSGGGGKQVATLHVAVWG